MHTSHRGYLYAFTAFTIFAAQDGISRHLGEHYPPVFIAMMRYWAFAIFVIIIAARSSGGLQGAIRANRPILQFARGALLALQVVLSIMSFKLVGLAQTHALISASPLIVAALSVPLLGERVGWRRWSAILVGFIGVVIILTPGENGFDSAILITVVASIMLALYSVMTRLGSRSDSAATSFFYTGVAGAITLSFIGPFYFTTMLPIDWLWLLALCLTGMSGHYLLIRALEMTDAASIQPFTYYQLVMVSSLGVLLYGEVLRSNMLIGSAVVVAAGLFTVWREVQRSRKSKQ
jgi:drug/metabolite transporter (DMT)-like permease